MDKLEEISYVMEKTAQKTSSFHLEVKGLGVFPNLKRVQVVWVGVDGETEQLIDLQKHIEAGLVPLGFSPEKRSFTPHLTLARLRDQATLEERQRLGQVIANAKFETSDGIEVEAVYLMKSQLTKEGAIYSRVRSIGLEKSLPKNIA